MSFEPSGGGSSLYPVIGSKQVYVPSSGVAAVDTAAIMAAHNGFGSNGGTIALDSGPYVVTGGGVNFTKPIHLLGAGPSGPSPPAHDTYLPVGSAIQCASNNANALTVNIDGCTFEKLYVQNTAGSTPVAGCAGIQVATNGRSTRIIDCAVDGFFICVDFVSGYYWIVDRCVITNPVAIGIQIDDISGFDAGDQVITATLIQPGVRTPAATGTAIFWKSGGGLRVTNCKVNNNSFPGSGTFQTALGLIVKDGVTTSVFVIANNSFENTQFGIVAQDTNTHTGIISKIIVAGNEFLTSSTAMSFNPTVGPFDDIHIIGNTGTASMTLSNVTNVMLHGPAFSTAGRPSAAVMRLGSWYYDTTLHLPGYSDTVSWRNAAGTVI